MPKDVGNTCLVTGELTVLRRLRASDLEDFQDYRTDPDVREYQSWAVWDDEKARAFLEEMSEADLLTPGEWCQIGIALAGADQLIGDIGICIDKDKRAAEIGITLSPTYQRRGMATEAIYSAFSWIFKYSETDRVYGIADKRNLASIELMKRLGTIFEEEYETIFEGEECIEVRHAMTRSLHSARPSPG